MAVGFSYEKSNQVLWYLTVLMLPVIVGIAVLAWIGSSIAGLFRRVWSAGNIGSRFISSWVDP